MTQPVRRAAIVSPLRTAVGKFGGALSNMSAGDLGATTIKSMLERTGILAELLRKAHHRDARYGLETMCIGGGQGFAAIFERA
mgnify:CR=1 FL=1